MLLSIALSLLLAIAVQSAERIVAIQIQGNTVTPEAEILRLAGLEIGAPADPAALDAAAAKLRASKQFERAEVLKRFASIADLSQILVVIVVDEGRVNVDWDANRVEPDGTVTFGRVRKARGPRLMFLPMLDFEDGYGLAYGLRTSIPDALGRGSLLSFPATWGGEKRVAVLLDKQVQTTPLTRIGGGAELTRRTHPFFDVNDDRQRVWIRAEKDVAKTLKVGGGGGWDRVSLLGVDQQFVRAGADVVLDTRIDPAMARNAVYGRASWEHLEFDGRPDAQRTELEARGYLGLPRQSVLVARALRQDSSEPLPANIRPMLGGMPNLRGFRVGTDVGDTLVAGSLELRVPLTSPLNVGKLGVSAFMDVASIYDKGQRLRDQDPERGVGAGAWFSAAFFRLNLYVARGLGGTTRVHLGTAVTF